MKIGIIDSGIDRKSFESINICQYRIYEGKAVKEEAKDYLGHGTAIASIISEGIKDSMAVVQFISICPGVNGNGEIDDSISAVDMAKAIEIATIEKCCAVNISMGTEDFYHRDIVDKACFEARCRGINLICARANVFFPTLPWASRDVIKVRSAFGKKKEVIIDNQEGYSEVVVKSRTYQVRVPENRIMFLPGNSFACAEITADLCGKILQNEDTDLYVKDLMMGKVEAIDNDFKMRKNVLEMKKVVLISFSKEMHGIIRFREELPYEIVGIVDTPKKGTVGFDAGQVMGIENCGIKICSKLGDIEVPVDTIIIGYLDQVEEIDENFSMDHILKENLSSIRANVYSFIPISEEWNEKYEKAGLRIESAPLIDEEECKRIRGAIPYVYENQKPVIGVFGTNSKLGKFTLQLNLKKHFTKMGIKVFHLSTEHQGYLLGADAVYPDGYLTNENAFLSVEEKADYIKRVMVYADKMTDADLVLVGNQSSIIPPDIDAWSFLPNASFLEGTKPDLSVLVINPYIDDENYIRDTISGVGAIFKCMTVALAFPNPIDYVNRFGVLSKKNMTKEEKAEISEKIEKKYGYMCGCITDDNYVERIAEKIINLCS